MCAFRPMRLLKTDMAGANASNRVKEFRTAYNVKLQLTPEGAQRRLGALEGSHAVRREQVAISMGMDQEIDEKRCICIRGVSRCVGGARAKHQLCKRCLLMNSRGRAEKVLPVRRRTSCSRCSVRHHVCRRGRTVPVLRGAALDASVPQRRQRDK